MGVHGILGWMHEPCESTSEQAVRDAVEQMSHLEFMKEAPLALPMEPPL
jgi:hypothetical protein